MSTKPGSTRQLRRHMKRRGGIRSSERITGKPRQIFRKGKIGSRIRIAAQNIFGVDTPVGRTQSRSISKQLKAQKKRGQQ